MKTILLALVFSLSMKATAQTFNGAGGTITNNGIVQEFPVTVSGLTPAVINSSFGLESVCIKINHDWDGDLRISLQAPDGSIEDLSAYNGGDGDNYSTTCFSASATTPIFLAGAPFNGSYIPDGFMGNLNNGQNGNGTWKLLVLDASPGSAATLVSFSISFGNQPAAPFIFTSSNLPIVVINTNNQSIVNDPKIEAGMGIIYNGEGQRNNLTDPFNNYNNKIGIELRGSSSQSFPQKSYGFETWKANGAKNDTILLGMSKETDWILYAPYDDKTCVRNVLSYAIANKTGHYASRTKFCELIINGKYKGIYVLMEKIKRGSNRVNISKIETTDISGDNLTGGYIIKVDRDDGPGTYWQSPNLASSGTPVKFVYTYPKAENLATEQKAYIQSYVDSFENALKSATFADPVEGYRKYLNENSFIDYFILNEISKNVDGYRLSTFLYKDKYSKGGKLFAGPAWDYNLAWWNADYCAGDQSSGWAYQFNTICGGGMDVPFWWAKLMQDAQFKNNLNCRWKELRQTVLNKENLYAFIDSSVNVINEARLRHFKAWPIIGHYTWPNPSPIPTSFDGEIIALKKWINDRITWLDANMPGTCTVTGIDDPELDEKETKVYPNPFTNAIQVSFYLVQPEWVQFEFTDVLGRIVKRTEKKTFGTGVNNYTIHVKEGEIKNGLYELKISTAKKTITKKIVRVQ